jgi:Zn-finger nucleic acid-binding protein
MNCPTCNIALTSNPHHGLDFNFCSDCEGVWLDSAAFKELAAKAAPEPRSVSIPSVNSQKRENFEMVYEGDKRDTVCDARPVTESQTRFVPTAESA